MTGAASPDRGCAADAGPKPSGHADHCITCRDEGRPMTVLVQDDGRGLALCVDDAGDRSSVETALVEPVRPGDRLLVHAGTAIALVDRG